MMPAAAPSTCDFCGAGILWLTTRSGARMPVDREFNLEKGNIRRYGDEAIVLGAAEAATARARGAKMRVHHRVTCTQPGLWPPPKNTPKNPKPAPPRSRWRVGGRGASP